MSKISLALKIKALADRGFGGEKTTASKILLSYCAKHNISDDDLEENRIKSQTLDFRKKRKFNSDLLGQILFSVLGNKTTKINKAVKANIYFFESTDQELIEISTKYDFYSREYENKLKLFFLAFIAKNNLHSENTDKDDQRDDVDSLSDKDYFELKSLYRGLKSSEFHKQIG